MPPQQQYYPGGHQGPGTYPQGHSGQPSSSNNSGILGALGGGTAAALLTGVALKGVLFKTLSLSFINVALDVALLLIILLMSNQGLERPSII